MKKILTILFLLPLFAMAQLNINNNNVRISASGDLTYEYIHGFAYKDSVLYTVNIVTRYVYVRVTPSLTVGEADGVTIAGDSITIATAGDYKITLAFSADGGTNDDFHTKMYINSAKAATPQGSCFYTTTGANNFESVTWFWYRTLAAGDDLSFLDCKQHG